MALRQLPRSAAMAGLLVLAAAPAQAERPVTEEAARVIEVRRGPDFPDMRGPARLPDGSMSAETRRSVGCLVLGTTVAGAGVVAGATNVIHFVGGGLVRPQNQAVIYLATVGLTFSSFCAIGAALTPLWDNWMATPPPPAAAPPPTVARLLPVRADGVRPDVIRPDGMRASGLRAHGVLADRLGGTSGAR